ncbi:MAG TPA: AsmA family protein [Syntrophorhabdaceae bacterium]|jgi:hypothetical protein
MRALRRKGLMIAGGAVVPVVIIAIIAVLSFNINTHKSRIEAAASRETGLTVRIEGRMRLSLVPFGVSAKNVHVTGKGGEILSLERLTLRAELMPLLRGKLSVTGCEVVKPVVTVVKDALGKYNFWTHELESIKGWLGPGFRLNDLKLSKGSLFYLDQKTGEKTELKEVNLTIRSMAVVDGPGSVVKNISFTGTMDCKEVLKKNVRMENLKASVKAIRGAYTFEPFTIGSIVYSDRKKGETTEFKEISLAVKDMTVVDMTEDIIRDISFTGTMDCKELAKKNLKVNRIRSSVKAEKGVFSFKPLIMDIFGAAGEGDITADKSKGKAEYRINLKVSKLDFEKLEESFDVKKLVGGKGDLVASLTVKETGDRPLLKGMEGTFSLRGDNLVTYTMDLDKVLAKYETSQKFHLADLASYFFVGPLGTVALKGYRYGDLYYETQGGRGAITQFISHWKIKNGEAEATDCALATRHFRVALKGKLNLVSRRFNNVTVALLDDKGCPTFKQTITGSFDSPRAGTVSSVESLAGPILDLYRKAKRYAQSGKCEVFYSGAVRQPR